MVATADPGTPAAQRKIAVSDDLPARHLLRLADRLGGARLELASTVLSTLRIVKDSDEIALLRQAAQAADRVVAQIAAGRLVGRTEADVSREVRERLIAEGHDDAHFAIVGSGPNSASPHHEASDRVIAAGEPIVLDIGGTIDGYGSDITRTLWVTGGDPARVPMSASVTCSASCTAPRPPRRGASGRGSRPRRSTGRPRPIDAEGYGDAFFHRTGHGSGSRATRTRTSSPATASRSARGWPSRSSPGSTCRGIRRPDRGHRRVRSGRPIALNEAPRELYVVDG